MSAMSCFGRRICPWFQRRAPLDDLLQFAVRHHRLADRRHNLQLLPFAHYRLSQFAVVAVRRLVVPDDCHVPHVFEPGALSTFLTSMGCPVR